MEKTKQNLLKAFEMESKARNKYHMYSDVAFAEGYQIAARILGKAAHNEREHAKLWFKLLHDGKIPSTEENIKDAVESLKFSEIYRSFAKDAREEGQEQIAELFEKVAEIDAKHEFDMKNLLKMVEDKSIEPDKDGNFTYECSECGCTMTQKERPDYCPLCAEPDVFFFKVRT